MRIAIYQSALAGLTPGQRIADLEALLENQNPDLIVCPELFLSGYNVAGEIIQLAETVDGNSAQRMSKLAIKTSTAIVYGYPEKENNAIYNSAICIDANGKTIANHRKLLLPPGYEREQFSDGNEMTFFNIGDIKFAILVCYDVEYPETVRAAAEAGAQVIVVPTALSSNWGVVANRLVPSRAFENGVWVIYANHSGNENNLEYYGGSCIVAPDGTDRARAGTDAEIITANIDIASVEKAQARLPYLDDVKKMRLKIAQSQ